MPSQPPIPPLLAPYLAPTPSSSLTLLTSTLGATSNWLVLRFIHAALKDYGRGGGDGRQETRIVLVSWLRDANFWREGGRKLVSSIACFTITYLPSTSQLMPLCILGYRFPENLGSGRLVKRHRHQCQQPRSHRARYHRGHHNPTKGASR